MCGIFGQITPGKPVNLLACHSAVQALAHRGPDGSGVAVGRLGDSSPVFLLNPQPDILGRRSPERCDFFLGHRRLSIIDLTPQAFQPMSNEDGSIWVVFNGEIYNHLELRRRLEALGHRFQTDHSDTEALIHGYEQWGAELVDELRGMFAFAVLDLRANRLLLARDRFGEKPLYYACGPTGVTFTSELKALACLPDMDQTLSRHGLVDYLHHGFIPAPRSIYQNVGKLRAAERLTLRLEAPQVVAPEIYWLPDYEADPGRSETEWFEAFGAELQESIRLRMISDVPLGAFLSGGLDSTVVTREMSRASPRPVNTFSIGFTHARFDESPYARRVARHFRTAHREEILSPQRLLESVPVVARMFDEPFADSSAIPTYLVSRLARREVTVALSGDGGDELLAGYRRYRLQQRIASWLDRLPDLAVRCLFGPAGSLWPESARGRAFLRLLVPRAKDRYFQVFRDDYLLARCRKGWADGWDGVLESLWPEQTRNLIDRMCMLDRQFYIPEDLMTKVDRTSMGVSLEARAPLLDHKLFELVARMPLETRFDGSHGKLPFRSILAGELGQSFVDRPKQGFSVPLGAWFRGPLRDELYDTLLRSDGIVTSIFSRGTTEKLIDNHCRGSRDQSHRLWKLYMLQQWHDCYGKRGSGGLGEAPPAFRAA